MHVANPQCAGAEATSFANIGKPLPAPGAGLQALMAAMVPDQVKLCTDCARALFHNGAVPEIRGRTMFLGGLPPRPGQAPARPARRRR